MIRETPRIFFGIEAQVSAEKAVSEYIATWWPYSGFARCDPMPDGSWIMTAYRFASCD